MVTLSVKSFELLFLIDSVLNHKINDIFNFRISERVINKLVNLLEDTETRKVYLQKYYEYYDKFSEFVKKKEK